MSTKKEEVSKAVAKGLRKFKEAVDKADQGAIHSYPSPNLIRLGRVNPLSYFRFGTSTLNGDSCYDPQGLALPLHHLWTCNVAHYEVSTHTSRLKNVSRAKPLNMGKLATHPIQKHY